MRSLPNREDRTVSLKLIWSLIGSVRSRYREGLVGKPVIVKYVSHVYCLD